MLLKISTVGAGGGEIGQNPEEIYHENWSWVSMVEGSSSDLLVNTVCVQRNFGEAKKNGSID